MIHPDDLKGAALAAVASGPLTRVSRRATVGYDRLGFRHKGLKRLFEKDDAGGIRPDLVDKVRTLIQLDEATTIEDMRLTSFHLYVLKADRRGFWSVTVRANWRIVFRFHHVEADDVELIDYH
jgi:proteic killer suppression protein